MTNRSGKGQRRSRLTRPRQRKRTCLSSTETRAPTVDPSSLVFSPHGRIQQRAGDRRRRRRKENGGDTSSSFFVARARVDERAPAEVDQRLMRVISVKFYEEKSSRRTGRSIVARSCDPARPITREEYSFEAMPFVVRVSNKTVDARGKRTLVVDRTVQCRLLPRSS